MTNRRTFLQIGLAATTLPLATGGRADALPAVTAALPKLPLYKVVFDQRFELARAFGHEAALHGAATLGFAGGDITDFWFHDLDLRWRSEPLAVAGFTRHGPLFVLERLAWDRGLRVVFRAEHQPRSGGALTHQLSGSRAAVQAASRLLAAESPWTRTMARVVSQCTTCNEVGSATVMAGHAPAFDEPFFSWVIAPHVRG